MEKEVVQNFVKTMPNILKTFGGFIKESFDKNGQETLDNANGVIGILINLFAKDIIDNYFKERTKDKLKNFGSEIYLQASLIQAGNSLSEIDKLIAYDDYVQLQKDIEGLLSTNISNFDTSHILTILQPKYHPIIIFVKNNIKDILVKNNFDEQECKLFLKNFNDHIEGTIISCFGESDYKKHKEEIKNFIINEREAEFLFDMFSLNRIGFKESENLRYEETYGKWENLKNLLPTLQSDTNNARIFLERDEEELDLVENLIEEYYKSKDKLVLREILFIVADFGKGKSVFLKQYASKLAKEYIETSEGYFPIYFNLRNFANYQSNTSGGVIADYLRKDYGIDITSDDYNAKKYIFLVDSLDESGELNKHAIENVINSIQDIQNINSLDSRENRILITSRPFEDGLEGQIKNHIPYIDADNKQYFLSIHGFKKDQFNNWIKNSIEDYLKIKSIETNSFTKQIIESIKNHHAIDIYELLIENNTLQEEELKRPIFAYMIFQLILNNIDFSKIGKTGVYLSFLNLLTKNAKHIDDIESEFNLKEEIESRNILHSISALWMYGRIQGKQGTLKKADIFRVLSGSKINDDDNKVLEENASNEVSEIKFLSHSYFGAKEDLLHFQHQSFAEMLLAEYYLKIFLKYSLDDDVDIEDARILLNLGEPTPQTIVFFKELLQLLKDSCQDTEEEKRNLLFPLLASLAIEKHNKKLRCNSLYYEWLKKVDLDHQSSYPKELIEAWCIDSAKISKITQFSKSMLESKKAYLTTKVNTHKALFDEEVLEIENESLNRIPHNIDKWLSLLVGNILYNNQTRLFNSTIDHPEIFFNIMKDWSYMYETATPTWANDYFKGIDISKNNSLLTVSNLEMHDIDFSFSTFSKLIFKNCSFTNIKFDSCSFLEFELRGDVFGCTFDNIIKIEDTVIDFNYDYVSMKLMSNFLPKYRGFGMPYKPLISTKYDIYWNLSKYTEDEIESGNLIKDEHMDNDRISDVFNMVKGFFVYGLKENVFTTQEIIDSYNYNSEETKKIFSDLVNDLG